MRAFACGMVVSYPPRDRKPGDDLRPFCGDRGLIPAKRSVHLNDYRGHHPHTTRRPPRVPRLGDQKGHQEAPWVGLSETPTIFSIFRDCLTRFFFFILDRLRGSGYILNCLDSSMVYGVACYPIFECESGTKETSRLFGRLREAEVIACPPFDVRWEGFFCVPKPLS